MRTAQSFPFYASDFMMGTMLLSCEEVGAYIRLLCCQWQEGSVPNNEKLLARLAQTSEENIQRILPKFRMGADGNLRNKKLEEVRKSLNAYKKSRSENGKKGGRPKKHMVSGCFTDVKHSESLPSPSPSPSPNTPLSLPGRFTELEIAISAIHSSRAPKAFSVAERNSLNELRSRITDEEMIIEAAAIKEAKDDGWQFCARTRSALLSKWESQAEYAKKFNNEIPLIPMASKPLRFA